MHFYVFIYDIHVLIGSAVQTDSHFEAIHNNWYIWTRDLAMFGHLEVNQNRTTHRPNMVSDDTI